MNKPPSYLIYPSSNNRLNSLLFVLAKEKGYLDLRPVHRLDKNTSGVCILAKVPKIRGFFIFISDRKKISNYSELSMKICFLCVSFFRLHSVYSPLQDGQLVITQMYQLANFKNTCKYFSSYIWYSIRSIQIYFQENIHSVLRFKLFNWKLII